METERSAKLLIVPNVTDPPEPPDPNEPFSLDIELTVDPNGSEKINGGTAGDPVNLTTEGQGVTFVYIDATVGWRSVQDNQF